MTEPAFLRNHLVQATARPQHLYDELRLRTSRTAAAAELVRRHEPTAAGTCRACRNDAEQAVSSAPCGPITMMAREFGLHLGWLNPVA